jgi:FK506-binding nuclear protein
MNVLCLQISINYTGKLKENGVVIESNAGEAPFKFRLGNISPFTRTFYYLDITIVYLDLTLTLPFAGKGEVIEGWDIGLEGNHLNIVFLFSLIVVFFFF